jgi:membrane protein implicated in regulation of membrane protease activity
MTRTRVVAFFVAIGVSAAIQLLGVNWYVSFALGIVAYFVTRYAIWAIAERRRFKDEFAQSAKEYHEK